MSKLDDNKIDHVKLNKYYGMDCEFKTVFVYIWFYIKQISLTEINDNQIFNL